MAILNDYSEDMVELETGEAEAPKGFTTYIKPIAFGEGQAYAVCTEDGVELAVFGTPEAAYYSARQHNLTPVSVH